MLFPVKLNHANWMVAIVKDGKITEKAMDIAKELTADGIPTPAGRTKWPQSTIESILTNEKYKGAALPQFSLSSNQSKQAVLSESVPLPDANMPTVVPAMQPTFSGLMRLPSATQSVTSASRLLP